MRMLFSELFARPGLGAITLCDVFALYAFSRLIALLATLIYLLTTACSLVWPSAYSPAPQLCFSHYTKLRRP